MVILNALSEKPIPVYGNGNNIRDWLYVDDHANALLLTLERGKSGRTYNIGDENERTNLEVVKTLCSILDRLNPRKKGQYADLITFVIDRPGHDVRYAINPSRIRNELGWQTTFNFDQNLEKTVQWYLNNQNWWQPLLVQLALEKDRATSDDFDFGKTGQVAAELQRISDVLAMDRDLINLSNPSSCYDAIKTHKPKAVINAAAYQCR